MSQSPRHLREIKAKGIKEERTTSSLPACCLLHARLVVMLTMFSSWFAFFVLWSYTYVVRRQRRSSNVEVATLHHGCDQRCEL